MHSGLYLVLEGADGSGKTTVQAELSRAIAIEFPKITICQTRQPGATPLGVHLRRVVKFPEEIDPAIQIDPLSRQMLYMVDTICFINTILTPALERCELVLADRSTFISSIAYSCATGVSMHHLNRMLQLIDPPRADRVYILTVPWDVALKRTHATREKMDHFDGQPAQFHQALHQIYDKLITGSPERAILVNRSVCLEDVRYVDGTLPVSHIVEHLMIDIRTLLTEPPT